MSGYGDLEKLAVAGNQPSIAARVTAALWPPKSESLHDCSKTQTRYVWASKLNCYVPIYSADYCLTALSSDGAHLVSPFGIYPDLP